MSADMAPVNPNRYDAAMRQIVLVASALFAVGCAGRQPIIDVAYSVPAGMTAPTADETVALPLARRMEIIHDVDRVVSISGPGKVDLYVVGTPGAKSETLISDARAGAKSAALKIPADAGTLGDVTELPEDAVVPDISNETIDTYSVQIDHQAAADAGVTPDDISRAMANLPEVTGHTVSASGVESLRAMVVTNVDGKRVRLGDIAAISIQNEPMRIRHQW
jgi:multidrug efflux pump subunit AcrB